MRFEPLASLIAARYSALPCRQSTFAQNAAGEGAIASLPALGEERHRLSGEAERPVRSAKSERTPHVAVVVLAYNGVHDTLACLRSLARARWTPLTVIVVDNGSSDGTAGAVREAFPATDVIEEPRNLGFAAGNNVGIARALSGGADYVFLLNNDTTLAEDAIGECVRVAQSHADAAAVCPLIYFSEPSEMVWYAGGAFDPRRARSGRVNGYRQLDRGQFADVAETDRATGAAVLLSRGALERVGWLDGELFFLYEDVDWSLRARHGGYRIYLAPLARVWHEVSTAAGGEHSPLIAYYETRNHLVVCARHAPLSGAAGLRRELGILGVQLAGARRARRRRAYLLSVLQGWSDGRRGRLGQRASDASSVA